MDGLVWLLAKKIKGSNKINILYFTHKEPQISKKNNNNIKIIYASKNNFKR